MIKPHVHVPYEKIEEHLQFIIHNRSNLEIYFSSTCLDMLSLDNVRALKDQLAHNPSLSFHAPFMDLSPGAVDSRVRTITTERFNAVLDIAEILRPVSVVLHSGYDKWKYALNPGIWLEKSLETWKPLNARAESLGIKLAVENIFEDEPSTLILLMEAMGSGNFGVCFDTGHFNIFSKVPLNEWLESLKDYIIEFHLHDNDKGSDQHLPIGEGSFDFKEFFTTIRGLDCVYTLETHSPEEVIRSIERLREFTA